MDVSIVEPSGLGDRSYLLSESGVAVVIDPQRDIDRLLAIAEDLGVRITHADPQALNGSFSTGRDGRLGFVVHG